MQESEGFWGRWAAAIAADGLGVSVYGMTNEHEDFAEAYVLYLGGGANDAASRARYTKRFAIIDALMPR